MKKYIRIIIPVLIFVAVAAFILFLPDISETGNEPQNDQNNDKCNHSYTYDNICAVCGGELKYTEGLKISTYDGYCIVDGGEINAEHLVIPCGYNGVPVMYIGAEAFKNNHTIKSVTLPEGLINIGRGSFYNCSKLEKVNIPSSVISIGEGAFTSCSTLSKAKFAVTEGWMFSDGNGTFNVGTHVQDESDAAKCLVQTLNYSLIFNETVPQSSPICEAGKHIYNPKNYCDICKEFWQYTKELSIQLASVKDDMNLNVSRQFVSGCTDNTITDIVIPYGYKQYGAADDFVYGIYSRAFYGMSHIKSILFPDSITTIREYAFVGTGIEKINIPPKVTRIYEYTFYGCASLTEVYIPKSVTQIDSMAFRNCTSLTKVIFEDPTGWEISGYAHEDDVFADPEKAAELLRTDGWRYTWMKK